MLAINISSAIRYCGADIYNVLEQENSNIKIEFINDVLDYIRNGLSVEESWKSAVKLIPVNYGLLKDDRNIINQFGSKLGATDVDGQMKYCEYFKNVFSEKAEQLKNDYISKSKIYRSLGFFGGLAMSIIMM